MYICKKNHQSINQNRENQKSNSGTNSSTFFKQ